MKETKINIITTFYNCEKYLEQCLNSILTQKYSDYHIYLINDASTDNSDSVIKSIIGENNPKVTYILNEKNKTALENIIYVLNNFMEPDSIYTLIDGDDFLLGNKVFSYVNEIFTNGIGGENIIGDDNNSQKDSNKVYFSYGSASWSNGNKCFSRPYSKEQFATIKKQPYLVSHLRCFLGSLWQEMVSQYPDLSFAKDKNGNFYKSGYDTILCIPMLMMCDYEHTFYNQKPLYFYRLHENNDHVKDQNLQWNVHKDALNKPNFKKIKDF